VADTSDHPAAPVIEIADDPSRILLLGPIGSPMPLFRYAFVALAGLLPALVVAGLGPAATPAAAESYAITLPIDTADLDQVNWTDTWGAPRSGGRSHIGVDMMGPRMVRLVAANDSEVTWGRFNNSRGTIVRLRDTAGWEYQYIHINNDTPGTDDGNASCLQALAAKLCETMESDGDLQKGVTFEAGEFIGFMGDSGNAEWTASHLHFEIYQPDGAGGVVAVNPTPYVDAARNGASVDTERVGPFLNATVAAEQIAERLEGRSVTEAERQQVAAAVAEGGLAKALADTIEGNPSAAMIDRLYLAFFQRAPDDEGLEHWIEARGDGHRLEDIAQWFAESEEFETRYGGTDFSEFLDLLYTDVLGRAADPEGKAYWLGLLADGEVTRGTIVVYFTESAELRRVAETRSELLVVHRVMGWDRPTQEQNDAWATQRADLELVDAIDALLAES
ncbi:MAG: DUF4214 domain-containing protein, partial [Actinomycetota bacterium]